MLNLPPLWLTRVVRWQTKNGVVRFFDRDNPFGWRPFLAKVLLNQSKERVIMKSRQVGVTELALGEMTWWVFNSNKSLVIVYAIFTDDKAREISRTRYDYAVKDNPYFAKYINLRNWNVYTKAFYINGKPSYIFFRSAFSSSLGESTSADAVILDEQDRHPVGVLEAFKESLSASNFGYIRYISTPTIPGKGIAELFENSCQYYWFIRCEHCGERQTITYEDNIQQVGGPENLEELVAHRLIVPQEDWYRFVCRKCKKELNRMQDGEWVAAYPTRKDLVGYHITQLMCPWISATDIIKKRRDYPTKSGWVNYVLGLPYRGDTYLLDEIDISRNCVLTEFPISNLNKYIVRIAGIDFGNVDWIVILGITTEGLLHILDIKWVDATGAPLKSIPFIKELLQKYKVNALIGDYSGAPDRRDILKELVYSVFVLYTHGGRNETFNIMPHEYNGVNRISISRHIVFQYLSNAIKDGVIKFPLLKYPEMQVMLKHLTSVATQPVFNPKTGLHKLEFVSVDDDHLLNALGYAYLGSKIPYVNYNINDSIKLYIV